MISKITNKNLWILKTILIIVILTQNIKKKKTKNFFKEKVNIKTKNLDERKEKWEVHKLENRVLCNDLMFSTRIITKLNNELSSLKNSFYNLSIIHRHYIEIAYEKTKKDNFPHGNFSSHLTKQFKKTFYSNISYLEHDEIMFEELFRK